MANAPIGMILAAGFGTRLYPLSSLRPKPLVEIGTKPIIYFLVKMLEDAGIKDVIINLHHESQQMRRAISQFSTTARIHFVYEKTILGTAGGIANALKTLDVDNRPMVLLHGDIFCDMDLKPFIESQDFCTLICDLDREVFGYRGSVSVDNEGDILELGSFFSRAGERKARGFFTGIHFLSADAVAGIRTSACNSLVAELYPRWLKEGLRIKAAIMPLRYEDLGSKERLHAQNMTIVKNPLNYHHVSFIDDLAPQSFASHICLGKDVKLSHEARIIGPVLIGHNVIVEHGAIVGPNAVIGDDCVIKNNALVENSVIMSKTTVEKDEQIKFMIGLYGARVIVS